MIFLRRQVPLLITLISGLVFAAQYYVPHPASEQMLRNLCTVHGVEWVNAVPHNIIGPRQKYDDPYRNVVSIMINLMLRGRQPIIYGDGTQKRCFSFIQDDIGILEQLA